MKWRTQPRYCDNNLHLLYSVSRRHPGDTQCRSVLFRSHVGRQFDSSQLFRNGYGTAEPGITQTWNGGRLPLFSCTLIIKNLSTLKYWQEQCWWAKCCWIIVTICEDEVFASVVLEKVHFLFHFIELFKNHSMERKSLFFIKYSIWTPPLPPPLPLPPPPPPPPPPPLPLPPPPPPNNILQLVSLTAQEIKRNTKESFMSVFLC